MFRLNFSPPPGWRLGRHSLRHALVLVLLAAMFFTGARPAYAASITVDGTTCQLVDAITAANNDTATTGCAAGSGDDTITLLSDVTLDTVNNNGNFNGDTGLPIISSVITIEGGGHTISRDSGSTPFRLLYVASSGVLTLNHTTLTGGYSSGFMGRGGGLYNDDGTVTVSNSTFANNSAASWDMTMGGGLYNNGTLTVNNSTFANNSATNGYGGGIFNDRTVTVNNSTLSGNTAEYGGGGIFNNGWNAVATLSHSLISGNASNDGAEINRADGAFTADNYNLIGYGGDARSRGFTPGATDIVPSVELASILATTLADNGGGTPTLALVAGSPAIDAAGDSGLDTDERGVTRPQGSADDIGAFELEVVTAAPAIDVQGNSVSIASGDTTPSTTDGTDFGSMDASSGTVVRTFTIRNTGTAALTLSGSPRVAVSGANAGDFTVTTKPASPVEANDSTTFVITFDPSAVGTRTATVTIANNDSNEGSYTFAIQGAGAQALQPTSQLTQQAGYTQSCTAATAPYVKNCTVVFTLQNASGGVLQVKYYQLTTLSSHVDLLNGAPNPGGVGAVVTGVGSVATSATFQPTFKLGLKSNTAYTVKFKIYGYAGSVVAASDADAQAVELGEYEATVTPDAAGGFQLFLPVVSR